MTVFTRARRRTLTFLTFTFILILFSHVLVRLQIQRITTFSLFAEYNENDESNGDKMGTTVSTHGNNEIENLVRKPEGDCVEDLGADRRTILKFLMCVGPCIIVVTEE